MKMTKQDIENLAMEVIDFLKERGLDSDVILYFNNKRILLNYGTEGIREQEGVSPLDYFDYVSHKHILSMSFEGELYAALNYGGYGGSWRVQEQLVELFNKYGLYYELGNSWNLSLFKADGNYDGIEYTSYEPKPEPEFIYSHKDNVLPELKEIMRKWYELSAKTGDYGCCVIGAGMTFNYKGKEFKMAACSPYQGEGSWTPHIEVVKEMLKDIGATNIMWNYGRMD